MGAVSKEKFVSSAVWKMLESLSTKGVSVVISVILARLLVPDDYGVIALTAVFINFTGILVQSGLTTALIRKKEVDALDYSNALFFSLAVAAACYAVFWILSPVIADFYRQPVIKQVLRVQMLSLFVGAFSTVRSAMITREFRFKELCVINLISTSASGIVGIFLAYGGFGVWSLVFYTLIRDILVNFLLFWVIKWKPVWKLSVERLRELIGFSVWILLSSVLDFWGNNFSNIILGKKYSMNDLGLYSKGGQLPELFCLHIFGAISSVLLPTMSLHQNSTIELKKICKKMVSISCYIIFPIMVGFALTAQRLVAFLYTEKWNACIPVLWMSCIYFGVNPLRAINMQLIYALGESRKAMYIELIRFFLLFIGIVIVIFGLKWSIYAVSGVSAFVSLCIVIITQAYAKYRIHYGYQEWAADMVPSVCLCLMMAVAVYIVGKLPFVDSAVLFMQIAVGVLVYWGVSVLLKNKCYMELKGMALHAFERRR